VISVWDSATPPERHKRNRIDSQWSALTGLFVLALAIERRDHRRFLG
jgi:hypothetical protein